MDDTTISAESPAWMQIPAVNVNPLSLTQAPRLMFRKLRGISGSRLLYAIRAIFYPVATRSVLRPRFVTQVAPAVCVLFAHINTMLAWNAPLPESHLKASRILVRN
eukprot:2302953-Pyramimonas_sp.AAC.1